MKKITQILVLFSILIFSANTIIAQIPSGFNYQAVVRNNDGSLMTNQFIEIRFTIFNTNVNAFVETYNVNTNDYGLVIVKVGDESDGYKNIDWTASPYSLMVEINKGNGFEDLGSSLIQSVPYSNLAVDVINNEDADADPNNEIQTLSISGTNLTISDGNTISIPNATSPWIKNVGNVYRSSGNVGIGTSSPISKLAVGGSGTNKIAIYGTTEENLGTGVAGFSTATTGLGFGGRFNSSSTIGRGVYGHAVSTTGKNYGGYFVSSSSDGTGINGSATSTTGTNYGGKFYASGNLGRGVYGYASSSSDKNYGGYFKADGETARGVFGLATSGSGENYGGKFGSNSSEGIGVYGIASNASGTNYGGKFEANGRFGTGISAKTTGNRSTAVYGEATSLTGPTYAGNFKASSSSGIGVQGLATSSKGENYGGAFKADGEKGIGVFGEASSKSDSINYGGYFIANGKAGFGVQAVAEATTGKNYGGKFITNSREGTAVYGKATSTNDNYSHWGGYFIANGARGIAVLGSSLCGTGVYGASYSKNGCSGNGVLGQSTGPDGHGIHGEALGSNGVGVYGKGGDYDFYAAGPGINYGSSSSKRWKNNIIEIDNPLEKLNQIRGVYYDWDREHGGKHDVGCIAEEIGKVLPEIVVYEKNGIDANGMDYSKLTPLLIEAVKAQQKLIDVLTKRVEELEK